MRGTRSSSGLPPADPRQRATNLPGRLRRAATASAARSSRTRPSSSTASARSTAPRRSGSRRRTSSSGSPRTRTQLLELYDSRPDFVQPAFRFNEARSFIAGGLQDFSISRAGQPWGIPIPWDESQVAYVWADALVNYLSALTYARPGEDLRDALLARGPAPAGARTSCASTASTGRRCCSPPATTCPQQLFVHGYLLLDEPKISKSLGNVVDPLDLIDIYGADPVRFWCARAVSFGQDGNVSIDGIHERYERELGNDLGNLLSRTTAMIARYRDGALRPRPPRRLAGDGAALEPLGGESPSGSTPTTSPARSSGSGRSCAGSTGTSRRRSRGSSRRTRRGPSELDEVLYDLADGLRARRRRALRVHAGDRAEDPRRARPAAASSTGSRSPTAARGAVVRDRAGRAALPAHRARRAAAA